MGKSDKRIAQLIGVFEQEHEAGNASAGDRANDPNQVMRATAIKLTDKEIAALAEYISGLH